MAILSIALKPRISFLIGMKGLPHIVLVSLYLLVTLGMTVSTHFCAGVPINLELGGAERAEPEWCCGEEEPDTGCCTTTVTHLPITDDHTVSAQTFLTQFTDLHCVALLTAQAQFASSPTHSIHALPSSPGSSPPLTILHRSLLI